MVRSKELDGFGKFRLPVLDDVTFVEDAVVPVDGSKEIDVVPDHLVRSDDDVEGGKGGLEETSLLEGSDVDDWTKVLGELEDLVVPVAGEGGRADDDGREMDRVGRSGRLEPFGAFMMLSGEDAERLKTLPQSHVYETEEVRRNASSAGASSRTTRRNEGGDSPSQRIPWS